MKKVSRILLTVFAVGVLAALFAGALAFAGYAAALIIGGAAAEALCGFIYKTAFPWVIRLCSVSVGCGLVGMYLEKRKALSLSSEKKEQP